MNELCRLLDVSLSSYYYHPVKTSVAITNVVTLINNISIDSGNTYGKRHIHAELIELDHEIGVHKTRTFMKKLNTRKLMFHSDQGVQYSAKIFRDKLALLNITQSMSCRGNCWDNAVIDRFFRSLKTERLNHITFINHPSVVDEVENYIRFYNYKRRHSIIEYMTPHQRYNKFKNVA